MKPWLTIALLLAACSSAAPPPPPSQLQATQPQAQADTECIPMEAVKDYNKVHGWRLIRLDNIQLKALIDQYHKDAGDISERNPGVSDEGYIARHQLPKDENGGVIELVIFATKGCFLGAWHIDPDELHAVLGTAL